MKLRDRRSFSKPEVMIIPMIDIMFFLLVFFMLSTLYMVNCKTVDVDLPKADTAEVRTHVTYMVSLKKDRSLWLEDKQIDEKTLIKVAAEEAKRNPRFAVVVRADKSIDYGHVMLLLDKFRAAGVNRFGLAAESGGN